MEKLFVERFTPAFFIFAAVFILLSVLNYGKLVSSWDEFSHWGDTVKAMTTLDTLGTNPNAHTVFPNYPPAMSLFQYYLQKLCLLFQPEAQFCEWRLYFSYQIFFISLLLPFLSGFQYRRLVPAILVSIVVCIFPMVFYSEIFTTLYIDPFLGILAGAALALVFSWPRKDSFYCLNILLSAFVLVLTKEAGLLFSVFLILAFILDTIFSQSVCAARHSRKIVFVATLILLGIAAIAIPKLLWNLDMRYNHVTVAPIIGENPIAALRALFHGEPHYRLQVIYSYFAAIATRSWPLGGSDIAVPYPAVFALVLAYLFFLYRAYRGRQDADRSRRIFFWLIVALTIVYIVGLCLLYLFRFSEYEAVRLASFERYINIVILAIWMLCVLSTVMLADHTPARSNRITALLVCLILSITPWLPLATFVSRTSVTESKQVRLVYDSLGGKVQRSIGKQQANVYLISQATSGLDYWTMRYILRPYTVNEPFSWSIGEPFFDGDIWTKEMTVAEWQDKLVSKYDYVILLQVNEYFTQHFSFAFEDPSEVAEDGIYRVNRQTHLLERCG